MICVGVGFGSMGGGWWWVDFNRCDFGGQRRGQQMQRRGSGGATTWAVDAAAWVSPWVAVFFFFFLGVDGRLWGGGGGVRGVYCSGGGDCGFEQKERERKNK